MRFLKFDLTNAVYPASKFQLDGLVKIFQEQLIGRVIRFLNSRNLTD